MLGLGHRCVTVEHYSCFAMLFGIQLGASLRTLLL